MSRLILCLACALIMFICSDATAVKNDNGSWTLHYAGPHNQENNTCAYLVTDCVGQIDVNAPSGPGRYDVYVIATDVVGIAQTRFGLSCDGSFTFYGWTGCADSEVPDSGWPGCGEGNAHAWSAEQPAGHTVMGILDVYVYGNTVSLCTGPDPRKGFGEWCDASAPEPLCNNTADPAVGENEDLYFGCVGFNGTPGVSRCDIISNEEYSWGRIKTLYR